MELAEQVHHGLTALRVQISSRLVGEEEHRLASHRTGDGDALLLAAGKLAGEVLRAMRHPDAFERVGLASRVHHFPAQLSGGQQQRVAVARAIVGRPSLLLADEPTGNLDSQMGDQIVAILHELHREQGTTIVMVTHDPRLAERTDRIVRLFDGRQVQ